MLVELKCPPELKRNRCRGRYNLSPDDMIKYMQFELDTDNPLIQISHQQLFDGKYGDFENGLFWQIFKNGSKPTKMFQNGGAFGTSSWLTIMPETKTGVFIITNVSGPQVHQKLSILADKIIDVWINNWLQQCI